MLFSLSVITAKGSLQKPVPLVVGIATNLAFSPSFGYLTSVCEYPGIFA